MSYDFTTVLDRRGRDSLAADRIPIPGAEPRPGVTPIPMWIADMSYAVAPPILEAMKRRLDFPSLGYFALYDIESFKALSKFIITTQIIAMAVYIIYPSVQLLRPEVFPRDNIFTRLIAIIYAFDTNTNVCPSLHVGYSVGIAIVWLKKKDASVAMRAFITVFCVLVCLSTAFIKQHSVLDAFAAIPMCTVAYFIAFARSSKPAPTGTC